MSGVASSSNKFTQIYLIGQTTPGDFLENEFLEPAISSPGTNRVERCLPYGADFYAKNRKHLKLVTTPKPKKCYDLYTVPATSQNRVTSWRRHIVW